MLSLPSAGTSRNLGALHNVTLGGRSWRILVAARTYWPNWGRPLLGQDTLGVHPPEPGIEGIPLLLYPRAWGRRRRILRLDCTLGHLLRRREGGCAESLKL
jgi:hypothetical protein